MSSFQDTAAAMAASTAPPGSQQDEPGPDTKSGDYKAMCSLWDKVAAMAGGVEGMRAAASKYLPKFELESTTDYQTRVASSPFTNIYEDIAGSLASKPFSREVQFEEPDEVDERFVELYDDIDGQGNNLHVFAGNVFEEGMHHGLDWILVDYTQLPPLPEGRLARSQAEESELGARPYWVHVVATRVVAAYSDTVRGKEVLIHVRLLEPTLEREGYKEVVKERVRVYERLPFKNANGQKDYAPATWRLEEKQKDERGKWHWVKIDEGSVTIGIIPMVPFRTGKRIGNGWAVKAPLASLVDMQLDAYQQESNLRNIELLTSFPMLTGSGVEPPAAPSPDEPGASDVPGSRLVVGPRAVLYAPPQPGGGPTGSWSFIEPSAENVKFLAEELGRTWENMREIGMQPLAEANITVITSANVSVKAKSALQAWALLLKDALEQAFVITGMWLAVEADACPGVDVYKDFGVDLQAGKEMDTLTSMAEKSFLSGETLRAEAKRRNILSDSFNEDDEQERLADEAAQAATEGEEDIDPVTGLPLSPDGEEDAGGEPVDPAQFADETEIDDETLESLGLGGGS